MITDKVASSFQLRKRIARKLTSESKRLRVPKVKLVEIALEALFDSKPSKVRID
jgi:hypothetical protein